MQVFIRLEIRYSLRKRGAGSGDLENGTGDDQGRTGRMAPREVAREQREQGGRVLTRVLPGSEGRFSALRAPLTMLSMLPDSSAGDGKPTVHMLEFSCPRESSPSLDAKLTSLSICASAAVSPAAAVSPCPARAKDSWLASMRLIRVRGFEGAAKIVVGNSAVTGPVICSGIGLLEATLDSAKGIGLDFACVDGLFGGPCSEAALTSEFPVIARFGDVSFDGVLDLGLDLCWWLRSDSVRTRVRVVLRV